MSDLEKEIAVPILKPLWLHPVGASVHLVDISEDSARLALATTEGHVKVLEKDKGDVLFEYKGKSDLIGICSLAFSADGLCIAFGTEDGWFKVYEIATSKEIFSERFATRGMVDQILWHHSSQKIFFACGKILKCYDVLEQESSVVVEEENSITSMKWIDQKMLGYTTYMHFKIIETHTGRVRQDFQWKGSLLSLEICPHKKYAVCGTQDQTIHIWNLSTKKDMEMRGFANKIKQLSFREDGLSMVHASGEDVIVWDFSGTGPSGKKPMILGPHAQGAVCAYYQSEGKRIASAGKDGIILLWNPLLSQDPLAITGIRDQEINCLRWSKDDSYLFAGFATGYATLIQVPTE